MDEGLQAEFDRRNLADQVNEKVWRIPAYEGRGPVTMKLLLPELTITDSDGRFPAGDHQRLAAVLRRRRRVR
jgi:hypothetical protein